MDAHQLTTTSTRYAAIHPRFPVASLAQVWVPSLPEALLEAKNLQAALNLPVTVMVRTVVSTSTYEEVINIPATSLAPTTANGEHCAEFEENGSCIHSDHTN